MMNYKGHNIELQEFHGVEYENEDGSTFSVNAKKMVYEAYSDSYGYAFATTAQDALQLIKDKIDRK